MCAFTDFGAEYRHLGVQPFACLCVTVRGQAGEARRGRGKDSMIHKTAVVDDGARMGRDVQVGPFAVIEKDTVIGDGCVIGAHASVLRYTRLGAGCRVHAGAVVGDVPQDMGFDGGESYVHIGERCVIRECVTVHRGTKPGTVTVIGEECFLMACSHVAHNCKLGPRVVLANATLLGGYVEIGERAFISGNCLIHQFCRIGRLAMLGGGSAASKDVPPFCTVNPLTLNRVAGLNVIGLRRAGFPPEQRQQVRRAFKILYASGRNVAQAVEEIRSQFRDGPALEFCDFAEQSQRGLCAMTADSVAALANDSD